MEKKVERGIRKGGGSQTTEGARRVESQRASFVTRESLSTHL